ncbi:MAG: hypothetical protein WAM60_24740 [Candidatus Promineifilaceae bacterium]
MPTLEQEEIASLRGRISRLEARLEYIYKHLGIPFVEDSRSTDNPQVIAALRGNNLIEAIKIYRIATNSSLAEAKTAVEEMRERLGL